MAEIIYNAVPFNGGTVSLGYGNSSMCKLTDSGKFVALFAQSTPNALIASVMQVTNAKTATPTLSVIRQQVLTDAPSSVNAYSTVRVWRLADDRILVGVNFVGGTGNMSFDVYSVNSSTGELAKLTTSSYTNTGIVAYAATLSGGSFELKQDCVLFGSITGNNLYYAKLEFNSTTNVLTYTALDTFNVTVNTARVSFQRKIGTTDQAIMSLSWYTANVVGLMQVGRIYDISSTGSFTAYNVTIGNQGIYHRVYGQLTSTTGFFTDGSYYNECNISANTLRKYSLFQGAADANSNHAVLDCFSLSRDYHVLVSIPVSAIATSSETTNNNTLNVRVIKYTDYNYAQASPGSANATKGFVIPSSFTWYNDKPMIEMMGSDVMIAMGLKSATEFTIRTIWF